MLIQISKVVQNPVLLEITELQRVDHSLTTNHICATNCQTIEAGGRAFFYSSIMENDLKKPITLVEAYPKFDQKINSEFFVENELQQNFKESSLANVLFESLLSRMKL